jgi:hypothetical protein
VSFSNKQGSHGIARRRHIVITKMHQRPIIAIRMPTVVVQWHRPFAAQVHNLVLHQALRLHHDKAFGITVAANYSAP